VNIEQFISQLESSDAYRHNKAVRKLVSESRQILIELGHGNDGEAFKAELMKFNDRLDIALKPSAVPSSKTAPETSEFIEQLNLREQYSDCLKTLSFYGFLGENGEMREGDAPHPTFEKAMAVFTPEMLELAATFQEPTLLLVPETSFAVKVNAIDAKKTMEGQIGTYQSDLYKKTDTGSEKITGWKAVIVDGAKEMGLKEGDDVKQRFDKRIEARKAVRKHDEKGMERHAYALLMMESLRKGEPIDKGTYTLLDDDPALSASDVPDAGWDDDRVRFFALPPGGVGGHARLRSAVGGVVLF